MVVVLNHAKSIGNTEITPLFGYFLGLSETCAPDNPFQLITDYRLEPNITSDVEMLANRAGDIREHTGVEKLYVDGGFHGEAVYRAAEENNIDIHLTNMTGKKQRNLAC